MFVTKMSFPFLFFLGEDIIQALYGLFGETLEPVNTERVKPSLETVPYLDVGGVEPEGGGRHPL